jgi:hypothetical protein
VQLADLSLLLVLHLLQQSQLLLQRPHPIQFAALHCTLLDLQTTEAVVVLQHLLQVTAGAGPL